MPGLSRLFFDNEPPALHAFFVFRWVQTTETTPIFRVPTVFLHFFLPDLVNVWVFAFFLFTLYPPQILFYGTSVRLCLFCLSFACCGWLGGVGSLFTMPPYSPFPFETVASFFVFHVFFFLSFQLWGIVLLWFFFHFCSQGSALLTVLHPLPRSIGSEYSVL